MGGRVRNQIHGQVQGQTPRQEHAQVHSDYLVLGMKNGEMIAVFFLYQTIDT
jgi:hypothetical protein